MAFINTRNVMCICSKENKSSTFTPAPTQGGHYSTSTGIYTCPVSGVYFFQFSIYGHFIQDVDVARASAILVKEGADLAEVHMFHTGSGGIYNTLSNAMVLQCSAGQRVWVESHHPNNHLFNWQKLNRFSGFLISPQ